MNIIIFQCNQIELQTLDIESYFCKRYPDRVIIRIFISSLYFDTFSIEILFF
jgi:coenzyme F420-reducing hydrogenase delta subunit